MGQNKVVQKSIIRIRGGKNGAAEKINDQVTVEAPVTIYLNGSELVTLLCTPEKTDCLALGFLRSEGLLTSMDDLDSIRVLEEKSSVEIELKSKTDLVEKLYGKRTVTSGCGKGTVFFNVLDSLRSSSLEGTLEIEPEQVIFLMDSLQDKAEVFKKTGGVHSAALASREQILYFYEDIGRHNAIDKIIGECMLDQIATDDKIIISSGRLSSEILLKTVKLKIQILISRAAPTSLCIELAEKLNVTLVGFVRGKRLNIYTHPWRIKRA